MADRENTDGFTGWNAGLTASSLTRLESLGAEIDASAWRDLSEGERRYVAFWRPYHAAMRAELGRLVRRHGSVLLCNLRLPSAERGRASGERFPDVSLDTANGTSCNSRIIRAIIEGASSYSLSYLLDAESGEDFIVRQYGQPFGGVHAVGLAIRRALYVDQSESHAYRDDVASFFQPIVRGLLLGGVNRLP